MMFAYDNHISLYEYPFEDREVYRLDDVGEHVTAKERKEELWGRLCRLFLMSLLQFKSGSRELRIVGYIESASFIDSLGQFSFGVDKNNFLVPVLNVVSEYKFP
ncbi:unnamed protein product [Arabidopsis lyrata]|nr:unnamed protein product [Arabidopsis lyrata]